MSTCLLREQLKKQRIPHITEENGADEAICKIPSDVPGIAPFDIKSVYQFTDEEFNMDLYPTYTEITKTADGVKAVVSDACLDELDAGADMFTWVSWIESVDANQKNRKWIIYKLLCTPTGDLSDDPDFKHPAVPFTAHRATLTMPFAQFVDVSSLHISSVSVDALISYDITYPDSWEPPWLSYEPPWISYEPPWTSYEPPWISYEPPWTSYEPPEVPSVPDYYFDDPPEVDFAPAPGWYDTPPGWFLEDPYPPPTYDDSTKTLDYTKRFCKQISLRYSMLVDHSIDNCSITISINEEKLLDLLCRQFTTIRLYAGSYYIDGGYMGHDVDILYGVGCNSIAIDYRHLLSADKDCGSLAVIPSNDGSRVDIQIYPKALLGVDPSIKWLATEYLECQVVLRQYLDNLGEGIIYWDEDGTLKTFPLSYDDRYLAYIGGKLTWLEEAKYGDCDRH